MYIRRALELAMKGERTDAMQVPPRPAEHGCTMAITVSRDPIYVAGHYLKHQRGLSQTPWYVDAFAAQGKSEADGRVGWSTDRDGRQRAWKN